MYDSLAFDRAKIRAMADLSESGGIGTLSEKLIHKILKLYFEPREEYHEIPYLGSVADIKNERGIIEVQTRAFDRLVPKLEKFLPESAVTVVYPIIGEKILFWLDKDTGELSAPRKSPRKGRASDALPELSKLASFIPNDRLKVILVFLSVDEYKSLDGWDESKKRGATKIEKIPKGISAIVELKTLDDYRSLIPDFGGSSFTAKDFNKKTALQGRRAYYALKFLLALGLLEREMGNGRAYVYRVRCMQKAE